MKAGEEKEDARSLKTGELMKSNSACAINYLIKLVIIMLFLENLLAFD